MTAKKPAVVFGVKCPGCGRMRYLKVKPAAGPYRCRRCRAPAPAPPPPAPPRPARDPFYADGERRAAIARRGREWIPNRPDWLR